MSMFAPRSSTRRGDKGKPVGAQDDGLGDGDQFALLVEDAQARGFPLSGIELFGSALRGGNFAGLNLR